MGKEVTEGYGFCARCVGEGTIVREVDDFLVGNFREMGVDEGGIIESDLAGLDELESADDGEEFSG